jgi:hypothetical protein
MNTNSHEMEWVEALFYLPNAYCLVGSIVSLHVRAAFIRVYWCPLVVEKAALDRRPATPKKLASHRWLSPLACLS